LFEQLEIPVVFNSFDDIDDIVSPAPFASVVPFTTVSLGALDIRPKDLRVYITNQDVRVTRLSLFTELSLPLCTNTLDGLAIGNIATKFRTEYVLPFVTIDIQALENYELDDGQIYLDAGPVAHIAEKLVDEFQDEIPICPNDIDEETMQGLLGKFRRFHASATINISAFDCVNPFERRIPPNFPSFAGAFMDHEIGQIPTVSNLCTVNTSLEILSGVHPLHFLEFVLDDCAPLIHAFQAPEDIIELLDDVVARLLALILRQDIVTVLPVSEEVEPEAVEGITAGMFTDGELLHRVAQMDIELLSQMMPNDIPSFVTPDEVVMCVLQDQVLAGVKLVKGQTDIDIDDLVALTVAPRRTGDDFTDPVVAEIVRKYKRYDD
jgi:hypothetical protein